MLHKVLSTAISNLPVVLVGVYLYQMPFTVAMVLEALPSAASVGIAQDGNVHLCKYSTMYKN